MSPFRPPPPLSPTSFGQPPGQPLATTLASPTFSSLRARASLPRWRTRGRGGLAIPLAFHVHYTEVFALANSRETQVSPHYIRALCGERAGVRDTDDLGRSTKLKGTGVQGRCHIRATSADSNGSVTSTFELDIHPGRTKIYERAGGFVVELYLANHGGWTVGARPGARGSEERAVFRRVLVWAISPCHVFSCQDTLKS